MKRRVLFVCVENAGRSQMAEALARMYGGERVEAHSAGSRPADRVNPRAAEVMAEKGYDFSTHRAKGLDALPDGGFDAVITMGCGDACPWMPAQLREDWALEDPKHLDLNGVRAVRDQIEDRVVGLLARLHSDSQVPHGLAGARLHATSRPGPRLVRCYARA